MKNLRWMYPIFTVGFALIFTMVLFVNLLIFGYLFTNVGIIVWILVQQIAMAAGYMWSRNLRNPDSLLWFAKKWWPETKAE